MERRFRHAAEQFDAKHSLAYWALWDQRVPLPWWLAAPAYPIVIGSRLVVWAGAIPAAAVGNLLQWRRSGVSAPATADLARKFVLVLRTFGHDGGLRLKYREVRRGRLVPEVVTLEALVGRLCDRRGFSVVGFADQSVREVPKGVRYYEVENDEWRKQFEVLVGLASAIVVMATPGVEIGPSFKAELEYIKAEGATTKIVVVGPPDNDRITRLATYKAYDELGWPRPRAVHLVAFEGDDGRLAVHPSLGSHDQFLAERYEEALEDALNSILGQ